MHELPAGKIRLLDCDEAPRAIEILQSRNREVQVVPGTLGPCEEGRLWSLSPWLESTMCESIGGSAVDLGCGSGRNALLLATKFERVTAVDHLQEALDRGSDLLLRYLPEAQVRVHWLRSKAEFFEPEQPVNFVLLSFFYSPELLRRSATWLAPGGSLVVEAFSKRQRDLTGSPANPDRVLDLDTVAELIPGLDLQALTLGDREGRETVRLHATRPT